MSQDALRSQSEFKLELDYYRSLSGLEAEATYALLGRVSSYDVLDGSYSEYGSRDAVSRIVQIPESPPGVDVNWNIIKALASISVTWFINQVREDGEMDYKRIPGGSYENFGNFNYGAVAAAFGFSEQAALRAAGFVQTMTDTKRMLKGGHVSDAMRYGVEHAFDFLKEPPYGDQVVDQKMIKLGILYYKSVFLNVYDKNNLDKYRRDLFWSMRNEENAALIDALVYGSKVTKEVVGSIFKSAFN